MSDYNRQYITVLNENGEKETFVNFVINFGIAGLFNLNDELLFFKDATSLTMKINITNRIFYDFNVMHSHWVH